MMDILTQLPTDSFVTAAFAELLEDVTNLLTAAQQQKPLDKDEVKFWRSQFNALNKAESYFAQGVRPTLSANAYLLASASRPGALVHRLVKQGGIVVCSCEAGVKGTLCWHHMLVNVIERAAELEVLATSEQDSQVENPDDGSATGAGPNPIVHASAAAQWLHGQQQLQSRLAATSAYVAALRSEQQRPAPPHIASQARAAYARAAQPSYRRPLFADRDAEDLRRQALAEERAMLLEMRARRCDPPGPNIEDNSPGDEPPVYPAPNGRRLGLRLVNARKKSAYFASAFYLEAA